MTEAYELRVMVEEEQADFVDVLRSLTDDQWDAPSLCDGWSVHDVVLHIAWHSHTSTTRIIALLGFALSEIVHRRVRLSDLPDPAAEARFFDADRAKPKDELIAYLASPATLSSRANILTQLSELVIHQQDVRRAVGATRKIPADRLAILLDYNVTPAGGRGVAGAAKRAKGVRLVADDMTWFAGVGPEVRGPGEAILMALNGRTAALDDLSGDGVAVLRTR